MALKQNSPTRGTFAWVNGSSRLLRRPFSSTRPGVSADPRDRTAMRNVITPQ